jgi:hypothetical protein
MHERWRAVRGSDFEAGSSIFIMKKSAEPKFRLHLEIYLAGDDNDGGREPDFEVRLNFFSKEVEICRKNKCIAEVPQT